MDFLEEILKLTKLPLEKNIDDEFASNDVSLIYNEVNKNMVKIHKSQREISYSIEEINEFVQGYKEDKDGETKKEIDSLIKSVISIVDLIEDFYIFNESLDDSLMKSSAKMIWSSVLKKMSLSGLVRIYDENTKADVVYNTIIAVEEDLSIPEGHIIKTIKSGYIYKNKVIRKSNVIVNKLEKSEEI